MLVTVDIIKEAPGKRGKWVIKNVTRRRDCWRGKKATPNK